MRKNSEFKREVEGISRDCYLGTGEPTQSDDRFPFSPKEATFVTTALLRCKF